MPQSYIVNGERVTHDDYVKTKYEDLRVRVPKGKKATIQEFAISKGESINGFINRVIDEAMELNAEPKQQSYNE